MRKGPWLSAALVAMGCSGAVTLVAAPPTIRDAPVASAAVEAGSATTPSTPAGGSGPPTNYIFDNGFESPPPFAADQRFSVSWIDSAGKMRRAAIRGDASIRDTDDPTLSVAHVGVGHYCLVISDVREGAVGVLQNQGGTQGTIDVTMGIGNPCPMEPESRVSVMTWQLP